jgi:hypothetical protein
MMTLGEIPATGNPKRQHVGGRVAEVENTPTILPGMADAADEVYAR